jgi:hypothetical protein
MQNEEESQNTVKLDDNEIENVAEEDSVELENNASVRTDSPTLTSGTISQTSTLESPREVTAPVRKSQPLGKRIKRVQTWLYCVYAGAGHREKKFRFVDVKS